MFSFQKGCQIGTLFLLALSLLLFLTVQSCQITSIKEVEFLSVQKVIDGDSVELSDGRMIRYKGINAPEKSQYGFKEALELNTSLTLGQKVHLKFDQEETDQYGRSLGYIFVGSRMVNEEMLKSGWAFSYREDKISNALFKTKLISAQLAAKQNHNGLWQKSNIPVKIENLMADARGDDSKNLNGEWVELKNISNHDIPLKGFILQDESNNYFIFPHFVLSAGSLIKIYSGKGQNSKSSLFLGSGEPIWNNESDKVILFDIENKMIDSYFYP